MKIINVHNPVVKTYMDNIYQHNIKNVKKIVKEYGSLSNQKNCVLIIKKIALN